jgi:hypothetical protein
MRDGAIVGMLLAFGGLAALVVLMPPWLHRSFKSSMQKGQDRMRRTGERNPYFGPATDLEGFLRPLRIMAALAALLSLGLAGLFLWS